MNTKQRFTLLGLMVLLLVSPHTIQARDPIDVFEREGIQFPPAQDRPVSVETPMLGVNAFGHDQRTTSMPGEPSHDSCLSSAKGLSAKIQADLCDVYRPHPIKPYTLWSWSDAVYAYGETAIKVGLALALLTAIRFFKRAIIKRSDISGSSAQKPESNLDNVSHVSYQYLINKRQKLVIAITAFVMVVMLMFPPFHRMYEGHEVKAIGYHFGGEYEGASIDKGMLCIQLIITFLVGVLGALLFHTRPSRQCPSISE